MLDSNFMDFNDPIGFFIDFVDFPVCRIDLDLRMEDKPKRFITFSRHHWKTWLFARRVEPRGVEQIREPDVLTPDALCDDFIPILREIVGIIVEALDSIAVTLPCEPVVIIVGEVVGTISTEDFTDERCIDCFDLLSISIVSVVNCNQYFEISILRCQHLESVQKHLYAWEISL
jgi:hypothetical protein